MNYTDLKAAITDWAHRSNIDAGVIDTFIDLAEAEFNVRLRTVDQETVAELLCTTRYTPLPADWLEMRAVEYQGETVRNLTYATPEMISQWRKAAPSGSTLAYTLRGAHIEVLPNIGADEPSVDGFGDDAQPFEEGEVWLAIHYWAAIPALSDAVLTNWLINAHPNMYLYECMRQLAVYTKDDRSIVRYANLMQGYYASLAARDVGKRFGGSALRVRIG